MASGKWYFEWYIGSANWPTVGIAKPDFTANYSGNGNGNRTYGDNGSLYGGSSSSTSTTYTTGDIIGCAVDMDNGKMWFSKNGTFIDSGNPAGGTNAQFTDLLSSSDMGSTGQVLPFFSDVNWATTDTVTFNAGQDSSFAGATTAQGNGGTGEDFYYTPPSGYKALNTDNLSAPAIALPTDHFNTVLYTGTGSSPRSITGVGFQPDFLWIKDRVGANNHVLTDVVRGSSPVYPGLLYSNSTIAEVNGASQVTSYDSDGFTMGATTYVNENGSSNTYVAWNWLAGGAAVSNTDGDITSSVSANPAAGFSIVSYTGVGTNAQSIGHGLTQTPEIIIVKNLDTVQDWTVMPGTSVLLGGSYYLELNNASDRISNGDMFSSYANSNVFYTGQNSQTNEDTKDIIAYCFHSVEGYSKVGSYTGNSNADGIFLYTGFKPSYVMIKCYDGGSNTQEWVIFDDARNTYNLTDKYLYANENAPDGTGGGRQVDFVSNGIKMRGNDGPTNKSNRSYIYLAFAESPFKYSNAR